jgi:hypothetical protein
MISRTIVRSAAAMVLAASALLPQYSCSQKVDMSGNVLAATPPQEDSGKTWRFAEVDHYVSGEVEPDSPGTWILPAVFLWPLAAAFFVAWRPDSRATRIFSWIEPVLLGFSLYVLVIFPTGTRRYGNYLAVTAASCLFALSLWTTFGLFRQWRATRAEPGAA